MYNMVYMKKLHFVPVFFVLFNLQWVQRNCSVLQNGRFCKPISPKLQCKIAHFAEQNSPNWFALWFHQGSFTICDKPQSVVNDADCYFALSFALLFSRL